MLNTIAQYGLLSSEDLVKKTMGSINMSHSISSGFQDLDRMIGGLKRGQITAIIGKMAIGKSFFVLNIARKAILHGTSTLVFTLDCPKVNWTMSLLCAMAKTDLYQTNHGLLSKSNQNQLNEAAAMLSQLPLYVVDQARTMKDIQEVTGIVADHKKIELIIIDGMKKNDPKALKALAEQWDLPIVFTQRLTKRAIPVSPIDRILYVHRDEYYMPDVYNHGKMDIRVPKMYHNDIEGAVKLSFKRDFGLID